MSMRRLPRGVVRFYSRIALDGRNCRPTINEARRDYQQVNRQPMGGYLYQ